MGRSGFRVRISNGNVHPPLLRRSWPRRTDPSPMANRKSDVADQRRSTGLCRRGSRLEEMFIPSLHFPLSAYVAEVCEMAAAASVVASERREETTRNRVDEFAT